MHSGAVVAVDSEAVDSEVVGSAVAAVVGVAAQVGEVSVQAVVEILVAAAPRGAGDV
jgi:hypothetical protein